ncbi:MAG: periplasmic binding protein [Bacteroidota bacterium]|nr:periplasmic binding protein [Bacteroidota bacterium]
MKQKFFVILFICVALASCRNGEKQAAAELAKTHCVKIGSLPVKYAKGFSVDYYEGFKVITVRDIKDSSVLGQYVLLPKGKPAPLDFADALLLDTPVRKIVVVSTNHVAEMERLNLLDSIAGVSNVELIYNKEVGERVKRNELANVGSSKLNYEKLVELHPSFVFVSGSFDGGDKMKMKLQTLHVKSILNLEYREQDPLGKAEWLKFVGALYDRDYEADSIFKLIEKNYLALKDVAKSVKTKPTVFCNLPFKEIWYMPCGENYIAKLIDDAGGDFLWKEAKATNGLNLNLNYESVYDKAANADIWINQGFASSLDEIKSADKKNSFFKAFKTGQVYNFNKRNTPDGGFDFWESGTVNPDKILADLIFIFHPELMKGHELYYYQKLK